MRKHFTRPAAYLLTFALAFFVAAPPANSLAVSPPRAAATSATTFVVTNKNNGGPGSLRQAILDANANPGTDTVSFDIPGQGVQTIVPSSALPTVTDPLIIDGTTQPGFAGTPLVELDGANGNFDGLDITAGGSTVKGLVIGRFRFGISLRNNGGNKVLGNFIGTDSTGSSARRSVAGINISSADNTIGGGAGGRNVISGNDTGISISGAAATGNRVVGNYIGTDAAGTARLQGNVGGVSGVTIFSASNNFIGGAGPGEGNVISGHSSSGVAIDGGSGNQVSGNLIGLGADGARPIGNSLWAVRIRGSVNNVVGGTAAGAGNVVAYSFLGVTVECAEQCATGNAVLGNSIFSNSSLGIDLGRDSTVRPNDAGDADAGANNLQNYPLLTSVTSGAGGTTVAGTLNSAPNATYRIEFFANGVCDPSGHGEGALFLGATTATTGADGDAAFSASLPNALPAGHVVTATATDAAGNTSEFSACSAGQATAGSVGFSTFNNSVFEDEGSASITVVREGGSAGALSVNYTTVDLPASARRGSDAAAGEDYVSTSGTLTFADGETTRTITVPVLNDAVSESTESVLLILSRAPGAPADSVGTSNRALLEIKDSGLLPVVFLPCPVQGSEVCPPLSVAEGDAGTTNATFTVKLGGDPRGKTVTVDYETVTTGFECCGVSATSGVDFQPVSGTLTFPPGVTTQTVTVPVNGDTLDEANELFKLLLKNPTNATASQGEGGGFAAIIDDDPQPGVSVNDVTVTESGAGGGTATFTVKLSAASGRSLSFNFATLDGTAVAGADYTATSGALTFAPGEVTKSVSVPVIDDGVGEPSETFFLTLTDPVTMALLPARGTCTILDGGPPRLLTEEGSERAVALDSVTMLRDPFPVEAFHNFAADGRTRIMLFATNVELQPGEGFSAVTAQARDSLNRVYNLPVEFVGKVPGQGWLTQINVRLGEELSGVEEVRVSISLRGFVSNEAVIRLGPRPGN